MKGKELRRDFKKETMLPQTAGKHPHERPTVPSYCKPHSCPSEKQHHRSRQSSMYIRAPFHLHAQDELAETLPMPMKQPFRIMFYVPFSQGIDSIKCHVPLDQ